MEYRTFTLRSFFYLLPVMGFFFACASHPKPIYTDEQLYNMASEKIEGENYKLARNDIEELEKIYPDSPHIAAARLAYADTYYKQGEYVDAIVQYQRFLDFHPRNKLADQAQYKLAMSYLHQIPNYERDQTFTRKALEAFNHLMGKYPQSTFIPKAKEKIKTLKNQLAQSLFSIAEFYYRTKAYNSAIKRFREVLLSYPQETDIAEKSMMFMAHSYLSQGSVVEAKAIYRLFLKKFPESVYAGEVDDYLGN